MHARTLEVLRPLGVTQALLAQADIAPTADLQLGSRVIRVTLAYLALPDTAFPHLSLIKQMDVERVLAEALADRGIEIERGTELTGLRDGPDGTEPGKPSQGQSLPGPSVTMLAPETRPPLSWFRCWAGWNRTAGVDRCLVGVSASGYEAPLLVARRPASTIPVAWTVVASCAAAASMSALEPAATVRHITRRT